MLEIKLHQIKEFCPVYKKGDRITVDYPEIAVDKTDALCVLQCVDPRNSYTDSNTVIFKCKNVSMN